MNFSRYIFWDVDFNRLDQVKHESFIIIRVLMRGTLSDWKEIKETYGLQKVRDAAINARYLDELTLNFCSVYFDIPKNEFRCYTLKQLNPVPWEL